MRFTKARKSKRLSSRPTPPVVGVSMHDLSFTEVELIASLLYNTKLGKNVTPWRSAAFTLLEKIELYMKDEDFTQMSAANVGVQINVLDDNMNVISSLDNNHFEIEV